ncbi:hypothetical protein ABIE44_003047 [Marmoricola sp. OAE513]|uniref:hypothetical protein n=1 Tax=Marmoricola sp. OAE513 TaxID=2817894 RepID=UPI001AEA5EA2
MSVPRNVKVTVVALGPALVVGSLGTVAHAATRSTANVKACTNAKGTLRLLSSKGKCPKGYNKVSIAKQGPQGPAGPGAKVLRVRTTSTTAVASSYAVPGTGLTVKVSCRAGTYGLSQLEVTSTDASSAFSGRGHTVISQNGDNPYYYFDATGTTLPGGNLGVLALEAGAVKGSSMGVLVNRSSGWPNRIDTDLMLVRGARSFTVRFFGAQDPSAPCEATAQVIRNG